MNVNSRGHRLPTKSRTQLAEIRETEESNKEKSINRDIHRDVTIEEVYSERMFRTGSNESGE